ncbi:MAG: DUF6789 family protein [Actinomycetota bacterium]
MASVVSVDQITELITRRLDEHGLSSGASGESRRAGRLTMALEQGASRAFRAHWTGFRLAFSGPSLVLRLEMEGGSFWSEGYLSSSQPSWVLAFRKEAPLIRGSGGPRPDDKLIDPQSLEVALGHRRKLVESGAVQAEELVRMEDFDNPLEAVDAFFNYSARYVLEAVDAAWSQIRYDPTPGPVNPPPETSPARAERAEAKPRAEPPSEEWRRAWLPRAVVSGFVATGAMTSLIVLTYWIAESLGSPEPQAPILQRWLWGLANNALTERTGTALPAALAGHFLSGLVWALVYALLAEPRLSGPGWRRGVIYSFGPWILSLVAFFPAVGGGPLGLGLGAGPLPIAGNLALHLVYGAALGWLYAPTSERFQTESGEAAHAGDVQLMAEEQRWIASGVVAGLVVGAAAGWLASFFMSAQPLIATVLGAVGGSVGGAFVGSFRGLTGGSGEAARGGAPRAPRARQTRKRGR